MSTAKKVLLWIGIIVALATAVVVQQLSSLTTTEHWAKESKPTKDTPAVCRTYYSEAQRGTFDPKTSALHDCTMARSPVYRAIFYGAAGAMFIVGFGWPVLVIVLLRRHYKKHPSYSTGPDIPELPPGQQWGQYRHYVQQQQDRERQDRITRGGY